MYIHVKYLKKNYNFCKCVLVWGTSLSVLVPINFGLFLVRNSEQNGSPHIKKVQIGRIFFFFLCVCPR